MGANPFGTSSTQSPTALDFLDTHPPTHRREDGSCEKNQCIAGGHAPIHVIVTEAGCMPHPKTQRSATFQRDFHWILYIFKNKIGHFSSMKQQFSPSNQQGGTLFCSVCLSLSLSASLSRVRAVLKVLEVVNLERRSDRMEGLGAS